MHVTDVGTMKYRDAWSLQERIHEEVRAGADEQLILVEHPPVITFGRRPNLERHLLASDEQLATLGVEVVHSDRGGEVTFHGPGQLVIYPIIRLNDHGLSVGSYVRMLLDSVIAALSRLGIESQRDPDAIGVWTKQSDGQLAKICALGVRIRRGVSMHGIALNVTTDLRYFDMIVPCGLPGRPVTSLAKLLGDKTPAMPLVKQAIVAAIEQSLAAGYQVRT